MEIALALLLAAIVGFFWYRSGAKTSNPPSHVQPASLESRDPAIKRVRLTDQQIVALSAASFDKPIYGENPSMLHAQMPNNAACFNLRTIESLVKRGYLKSDGKGGFLLTPEGMNGLRSGMGF